MAFLKRAESRRIVVDMSAETDQNRYNSEWRERLLRDNLRNIEALVESGTPLTPGQVDIVKKSVDAEEKAALQREEAAIPENDVWVKTVSDLLAALGGISKQTLSRWRKKTGAPLSDPKKGHNVTAWRRFAAAQNLIGDNSSESLRLRKLRAEAEEKELKTALKKGELISRELVRQAWLEKTAAAITNLRAKLEKELPPLLVGMEAPDIQAALRQAVDEYMRTLHDNKPTSITP